MSTRKIGVLHPGEMGFAVAVTAKNSGHDVYWCSESRSAESRRRAAAAGLADLGSLARLCAECEVIVSICPPGFTAAVADELISHSFHGLFIDANAISPEHARQIAERITSHGIRFIDGCVIGLPATERGKTWLYLSGPEAEQAARCFTGGPLECEVLAGGIGQASALKMCFAAHAKGLAALRAAVLASASEFGVLGDLERQWSRSGPAYSAAVGSIQHTAPKAWRFVAEMHEIADTFAAAGMPRGFHLAAAEIFGRLAPFKGVDKPALEDALRVLAQSKPAGAA